MKKMELEEFDFIAGDGAKLRAYCCIPQKEVIGVVLIVHGMAEHARRYTEFAGTLATHAIASYSLDLRGHGQTAGEASRCGYFAETGGWMRVAEDIMEFARDVRKKHSGKPLYMLGHSMGSFLARTCIADHSDMFQGCILSGTATHPVALIRLGSFIASLQRFLSGKKHPSRLLDRLSFGSYNKKIKNPKTRFDWLSRDSAIVHQYVSDPFCGFVCSCGFFHDLFSGLKFINSMKNIRRTSPALPMLLLCGSEDPVSNYSVGMLKAAEQFRMAGVKDITTKVYEGGRHEMLNEINKKEVCDDIVKWLLPRVTGN